MHSYSCTLLRIVLRFMVLCMYHVLLRDTWLVVLCISLIPGYEYTYRIYSVSRHVINKYQLCVRSAFLTALRLPSPLHASRAQLAFQHLARAVVRACAHFYPGRIPSHPKQLRSAVRHLRSLVCGGGAGTMKRGGKSIGALR